jgi:hypothetical protein
MSNAWAPAKVVAEFAFGAESTRRPDKSHGLSAPEPGFTWSLGPESGFSITLPPQPAPEQQTLLELSLSPHLIPPALRRQRLGISVNGQDLDAVTLDDHATLVFPLPPATQPGPLAVKLTHPDAASPAEHNVNGDARPLAFALRRMRLLSRPPPPPATGARLPPLPALGRADLSALPDEVRALTGLAPADLMLRFESLGHNCEFGIAQRRAGVEPLGLLRFAAISQADLIAGLAAGFAGVDAPEDLIIFDSADTPPEMRIMQRRYALEFHTFRYRGNVAEATVRRDALRNLGFYRRTFLETLAGAEKLCVVHAGERGVTLPQAYATLLALRAHGPNALLFVVPGPQEAGGSVARLEPGLYRATLPRFAPGDRVPEEINVPAWLSIAANAYDLWREDQ